MAIPKTDVESQAIELSTEAFQSFCDGVSSIFGVEIGCERQEIAIETATGLQKRFQKLVAVNVVHSEGILNGTFQLIFDQEGIFTLGGVITMLPEETIVANRNEASAELAENMVDAVGEVGNLLIGSIDKVFREASDGDSHCVQRLPAFVGKPWGRAKQQIGLAIDEELVFVPYQMTVGSFAAFNCGVIFPRTVFGGTSDAVGEQATPTEEEGEQKAQEQKAADDPADSEESSAVQGPTGEESMPQESATEQAPAKQMTTEEDTEQAAQTENAALAEETVPAEGQTSMAETTNQRQSMPEQSPKAAVEEQDAVTDANVTDDLAEENTAAPDQSEESSAGTVSETIRKMAQSPAVLPGESVQPNVSKSAALSDNIELLRISARDIMQDQVVWADPDDSVQQALAAVQQHHVGYIMIGQNGVLEGIVSESDIIGTISPYLRPMFAKWRRPSDDATLRIRVKWIMSSPVRTVKPETSLAAVMENMCQFGGHALAVVDEQGEVHGLVTVFDIFRMLLKTNGDISTAGRLPQGSPPA